MIKICEICSRSALKGNSRSHSNIATSRWQKVNLQKKTVDGKKIMICTRCLRTKIKASKVATQS